MLRNSGVPGSKFGRNFGFHESTIETSAVKDCGTWASGVTPCNSIAMVTALLATRSVADVVCTICGVVDTAVSGALNAHIAIPARVMSAQTDKAKLWRVNDFRMLSKIACICKVQQMSGA